MDTIIVKRRGERLRVMRSSCYLMEIYETGQDQDQMHDLCVMEAEGDLQATTPAMVVLTQTSMRIMEVLDHLQDAADKAGYKDFDVRGTVMAALKAEMEKANAQ